MTPRYLALVIAGFVSVGPAATADTLRAHLEQPLQEVSHTVDIRIENGVATYIVQRQFRNTGTVADEVRLGIRLPDGAAATGLRIRAKQAWHAGELLERTVAADRYSELTGKGVYDPKDPALLFWLETGELFLQVFPVMPKTTSTVEYTLTVPTKYAHGRYLVTYPRAVPQDRVELRLVDPVISVRSEVAYAVDKKPIAPATRVTLRRQVAAPVDAGADADADVPATSDERAQIAISPAPIARWTARWGGIVASSKHAFARLELDTAPQISALPKRAQVVFVLDTSHSAASTIPAQLAIVRAYAGHVPDAELELVAVRRTGKRVFGAFVSAGQLHRALEAAIARGALAPGNGSALDDGVRVATAALAGRVGPHRIVIATDERVRRAFPEATAIATLAALDPAAVVHVIVPEAEGVLALSSETSSPLSALVTGHHGIFGHFTGLAKKLPRELPRVVLGLVRPTRIDMLAATCDLSLPETLDEGEGARLFADVGTTPLPAKITITGLLWSDPIRLEVSRTADFERATAAFVFGEAEHTSLDEPEMMVVAKAARAVSPVTSYLAIEPGVRPSKIGLPDGSGTGWGTIGTGRYGTVGVGGGGGSGRQQPDLQSMIDSKACVKAHRPAAGWGVKLAIETTHDEIVDVRIQNGSGPLAACLVEAAWAVRLDSRFDLGREDFIVDLF